ncbi:MAG: hypothetical protein PHQ74_01980 [Crocinitomicaceae bacterium]|nr:hypothetical protein [Crocinitomicaceae bacterium]
MKTKKSILYLCLLSWIIPYNGVAQFTYFDVGITQAKVLIMGKSLKDTQTKILSTEFHVGGLWRFARNFGVGLDAGIPMTQKSKVDYRDAYYRNNFVLGNLEERYKPQKFDYSFEQSARLALIGRIYFGVNYNWFLDARLSTVKLKSNFEMERIAQEAENPGSNYSYRPAIVAVSIHEKHDQLLIVPGFAIGFQPHLGKRFFMNFNVGFDFYTFKENNFSHAIPWSAYYSLYGVYESVIERVITFTSPPAETKMSLSASVKFGMFF